MKKTTYLLAILGVFTILSYQNCSQELGELGGKINKVSDGIPFPIEVDVDTIARMSCFHSSTENNDKFFSFKANFHNPVTSGIKRSTAFDTFISTKTGSAYENRRKYLKESVKIKGLRLQLSLKDPTELSATLSASDGTNYRTFYQHLDFKDSQVTENLVNYDEPTGFSASYMSAALDLRKYNVTDLYSMDGGKHVTLSLDYVKTNDPKFSVGPYTFKENEDTNSIYGNKYKLFLSANEKRVDTLTAHSAVDGNLRSGGNWICQSYKIIRAGDSVASCSTQTGVALTASSIGSDARLYQLLGSGWKRYGSGLENTCIQHDSAMGCYGEANTGNVAVAYNLSSPCSDAAGSQMLCANFLSVCSKNNF